MNDRIKIANRGKGPDVMLSRQVVLQCGMLANMSNGCNGGEPRNVFDFMHEYGLPDETCMLYKADDQVRACVVASLTFASGLRYFFAFLFYSLPSGKYRSRMARFDLPTPFLISVSMKGFIDR